ncbi:MAG: RHS repeat-associated core domain-containing protein, partial [Vicinamibacterales bacterium]
GARYYRGVSGRFTTVDPVLDTDKALADPQRWNRYAYARNNPLAFIDPDGRDSYRISSPLEREAMRMAGLLRDGIANALGADSPGPHGRLAGFARNAIDSVLATVFPRDVGEAANASNAAILGVGSVGAQSAASAAKLSGRLASEEIASGHAFVKHVVEGGEFAGIRTRKQFADMIENVMDKASLVRELSGGRTAFWREGVVVIRNPLAADGGTAFVPENGFKYFLGLR